MSHELESMFYTREVPWHGLGTKVDTEQTAEAAIKLAGLDWDVVLEELYIRGVNPVAPDIVLASNYKLLSQRKAVMRATDHQFYSVVSPQYTPIQNRQAFSFFDEVVGEGKAIYHTAGSLKQGARIWILAKLPNSISIKGVDQVDNYLLLTNTHDSTAGFNVLWTPIRVVCNNTLNLALERRPHSSAFFYARHMPNIMNHVKEAQEILGFANHQLDELLESANRIANQSFLKAEMDEFLSSLFEVESLDKASKQVQATSSRIAQLVEVGAGSQMPEIRGSKWALFNAVTEYVDHERWPNSKVIGNRLYSAWYSTGAELKQRAWELINKN